MGIPVQLVKGLEITGLGALVFVVSIKMHKREAKNSKLILSSIGMVILV